MTDSITSLSAAVAAVGALPVPVGDQAQPLDDTRLAEIAERIERRFDRCCKQGQVSPAQLNFMANDARAAVAVGMELLAEVQRLRAERHTTNEALSDAAEQLRANRDRIRELERPAVEAKRDEVRQSYAELAAQCREDRDHESAFDVECRLREREEQWKREDAAHTTTDRAEEANR